MVGWAASAAVAAAAAVIGVAAAPHGVAPKSSVSCGSAVGMDPSPTPDNGERVVANRITLPSIDLPQVVRVSYHPPFRYWRKAAILVRPRRTPVDVIVPRAWRDRVAVTWG